MKRVLSLSIVLGVLFLSACGGTATASNETAVSSGTETKGTETPKSFPNTRLSMGTSSVSSTYYILGGGWSNMVNNSVDGVEVSIEATPGGITNMQSMRSGDMDIGMTTCWLAGQGKDGTDWANGTKYDSCKSIFPTHSSVMYIFTLADNGIETIKDLEGKQIGCGSAGSTSGDAFPALMKALGVHVKGVTGLSSTAICDALKDGTIDVGVGVTGIPAAWLLDLETTKNLHFIPLSDGELKTVLAQQPYWAAGKVPAGTYKNQEVDLPVISFWNMVVVNDTLSEELVYELCRATYEHIEELKAVDGNAAGITYENLDKMTMPLHPGALKYYRDMGAAIPDSLVG